MLLHSHDMNYDRLWIVNIHALSTLYSRAGKFADTIAEVQSKSAI